MISFLLSPVMSFFSIRLYREALHSGLKRGFGYLVYLTILFCLLVFFLCRFLLLPVVSDFADWLIQVTPEMTLTQSGLNTAVHQPYLVRHPALGPLYLIDTTKSSEELIADQSKAIILIGKEKVVVRNLRRSETRVFDLQRAMTQAKDTSRPIQITKRFMRELNRRIETLIIPIVLLFLAPIFFIWKLFIALFYFLIALLLNLFRKEKFRAPSLFTLSCYAISPVTLIQVVHISIPDLYFNLNFYFAFALTVAYLIYGMFVASRTAGSSTPK